MRKEIISKITDDILYLPEIIFRSIHQNIIKEVLAGISPLHFRVMTILKTEKTLKVAEIADRMNISRPQMTRLIDKLIELDMVERHIGEKDRRTINISLTKTGRSALSKNDRQVRKAIGETLSNLENKDLKDLAETFKKLKEIFSKLEITKKPRK